MCLSFSLLTQVRKSEHQHTHTHHVKMVAENQSLARRERTLLHRDTQSASVFVLMYQLSKDCCRMAQSASVIVLLYQYSNLSLARRERTLL